MCARTPTKDSRGQTTLLPQPNLNTDGERDGTHPNYKQILVILIKVQ